MSLIINMLKDLDRRHAHTAPIPAMATEHQRYEIRFASNVKWIISLAITIVFIFILTYLIQHHKVKMKSLPLPIPSTITKSVEPSEKTNEPWLLPIKINGVTFEANSEATKISFLLNHQSLYRIESNQDKNTISLVLDKATLVSDVPTLVGADIAIQSITASTYEGNVRFNLQLKAGSTLESVDQSGDNDSELTLTIASPKMPTESVIANSSSVKTPAIQSIIIDKYQSAVKLAEAGDTGSAIEQFNKLLQFYPDYNDVRVSLAAIYLESGKTSLAHKVIEDGLAIDPDYLPLIELKARVLTSEGKVNEALMVLQSEQPSITDAPSYHALIAALFNRQNNYQVAANIYQKLVQINPHEGSWWFGLAVSLDKLGHNQDAVYAYTKAATEGRLNSQALAFLQTRLQSLKELSHDRQ